ncbi:MAG: hypothetical protein L0G87_07290 [Renibacterium salmoninarum]|nr:hypothetical protein [Renibacterium salmoninarum]
MLRNRRRAVRGGHRPAADQAGPGLLFGKCAQHEVDQHSGAAPLDRVLIQNPAQLGERGQTVRGQGLRQGDYFGAVLDAEQSVPQIQSELPCGVGRRNLFGDRQVGEQHLGESVEQILFAGHMPVQGPGLDAEFFGKSAHRQISQSVIPQY